MRWKNPDFSEHKCAYSGAKYKIHGRTYSMLKVKHILYYCRDLDQASMEAVAALLAGLPLQPEESDRGDLMEAKSQLFLK